MKENLPANMIALSDEPLNAVECTPHSTAYAEALNAVKLILNPESSLEERKTATCCFLVYIYEQIDAILRRSVTQSNSRSNTPLFPSQTPPLPAMPVETKMSEFPLACRDADISQHTDVRPTHKVQLFSARDDGTQDGPQVDRQKLSQGGPHDGPQHYPHNGPQNDPQNGGASAGCVRPLPLNINTGSLDKHNRVRTTCVGNMVRTSRSNSSKTDCLRKSASAFKPNYSSTPSHKGHHSITLADFVPITNQKKRNRADKRVSCSSLACDSEQSLNGLNHELASLSVGTWARGEESVSLLKVDAFERVNSSYKNNSSRVSAAQGCGSEEGQSKQSDSSKPSRRITPTAISAKLHRQDFKQAVFIAQNAERNQLGLESERQQLKEKKAQLMSSAESHASTRLFSAAAPTKMVQSKGGREECVRPIPSLVTHKHQLHEISLAFTHLVDGGQTEDLMSDLQLLVQLLCSQIKEGTEAGPDSILETAHNAVYFAVTVLCESQVLLRVMDHSIRRLLSDNERVKAFNAQLADQLAAMEDISSYSLANHNVSSVSFQADTDDSKNFPSQKSFIVFKKQRDLFYEIKRDWDNNHSVPSWSFTNNCSERIGVLLNFGGELSNYIHLCRLFTDQLLLSCLQDGTPTETDGESIRLLSQLKLSQPEKYQRLRERLVKPLLHSVQSAKQDTFSGQEIFFKLVVDVANNAVFTQHLSHDLTLKLLNINSADLNGYSELESDGGPPSTLLSHSILTSRLVAKFLGYIHFLPYRSSERRTAALDEQYRTLRGGMSPPLDIGALLTDAISWGRCVLFLPWLVAYLSQVDPHTASLLYYTRLLSILRNYLAHLKDNMLSPSRSLSACMLQYVSLNWLFSLPQFEGFRPESPSSFGGPALASLDHTATVDLRLLHDYSDPLKCIKRVLVDHVMDMRSRHNEPRKITPLTADTHTAHAAGSSQQDQLNQALEDNFFHNQPPSLRRTVNFLSERLSSSYIKEFRLSTLTSSLTTHKHFLFYCIKNISDHVDTHLTLAPLIAARSQQLCDQLHTQLLSGINVFFEQRVKQILELLLPSDTQDYVFTICAAAISRQGLARVTKWLKTNLTHDYIMAELNQAVTRYCRSGGGGAVSAPSTPSFSKLATIHNNEVAGPSQTLLSLQECVGELTANQDWCVSASMLVDMLKQVVRCLTQRQDVELITVKSMCWLTVQLLIKLVDRQPEMVTSDLLQCYQQLWRIDSLEQVWRELTVNVPAIGLTESMNIEECLSDYILSKQQLMALDH